MKTPITLTVTLLSLLPLTPVKADVGDWVEGVAQGVDTIVSAAIYIHTYLNDYESSVAVTTPERYQYDSDVLYRYGNNYYASQWLVYRDWNGVFQYRSYKVKDGVKQPVSSEVFEVGGSEGLPCDR